MFNKIVRSGIIGYYHVFKAIDNQTATEVIILDDFDVASLDVLRAKGRADILHCPVCKQSVLVKAGQLKRPHFAHKHLSDCPSSNEPPELLHARAVLYAWLKSKFGEGVTLEKRLDNIELPRSIDCWVEHKEKKFAYWILVGAMKRPEDRQMILMAIESAGAVLNVLFTAKMIRRSNSPQGVLLLTTTERDLAQKSLYDEMYSTWGESLHYLEGENRALTTFRNMHCTEAPQQFSGTEICTPLEAMKVSPLTGEFVHPDEDSQLAVFQKAEVERKMLEAERAEQARVAQALRLAEAERRNREWESQCEKAVAVTANFQSSRSGYDFGDVLKTTPAAAQPPSSQDREGKCIYCGKMSRDWWFFDGKTGMCKCKSCGYQAG